MNRYTIVSVDGGQYFGPPPKALAHSSHREHLHAAIRDALAFIREGERATVSLYDVPTGAKVPVMVAEVAFTKTGGRARDLEGDADWLMPYLRPVLTVYLLTVYYPA